MGVGPIIRQTVAEYKKQQGAGTKSSDGQQQKDVTDLKRINKSSANSLASLNAQFRAMNNLLKDIRNIGTAQLKAQNKLAKNGVDGGRTQTASPLGSMFSSLDKNEKTGEKTGILSSLGDLLSGNLGTIAKVGLGLAAGGLVYKNKDEIKGFLEDFLKGAGLPSTEQLTKQINDQIVETTKEVSKIIGGAVVDGIKEAYRDISPLVKDYVKKGLGLEVDEGGNSLPVNKKNLGGMVGATTGFLAGRKVGGLTGGIVGGTLGFFGGEEYSEEVIGAGLTGASLYGAYKGFGAINKMNAARAAAAKAPNVTPTVPAQSIMQQPWQVPNGAPTSPLRPGERMSAGGIILPAESGARTAGQQIRMDNAANKQLTTMEKAGVRVGQAIDAVGEAGKQAGSIFSKYGGKILGALNVAMVLPQIYDDISNGDYAAAGMEAAGLVGSFGAAALSPFITPAGGAVLGMGVSVGSSWAASKLRTPRTTGASVSSTDATAPTSQPTTPTKPSETPAGTKTESSGETGRSLLTLKFSDLTEEEKAQILSGQAKAEGWFAGSMSYRNNNPGNLKFAKWMTEFGAVPGDMATDGGQFARFPSKQAGLMAQRRQWERPLYANLTIAQGLRQWHGSLDSTSAANYAKTVVAGSNILAGDVNSPSALAAGATAAGATPTPAMIQTRNLQSLGLKDDQIATLQGFQEMIRGFNDLSNVFTGNFDNLPGNVAAAAPSAPTPSGGNSSKAPPSVPPVSMYKEKHSFGQTLPWYASGRMIPQ